MREESGITLCRDFLGIDAIHVLDPTMLIKSNKYQDLCKNVKKQKESYIAAYCIDIDDKKRKIFEDIANKKKLPLKLFSANSNAELTIKEWLSMFRDANYVITDSFHGTVFSIIFHKPFYSMVNEGRGTSRFYSLLSSLGLDDRIQIDSFDKVINWDAVENELCKLQEKSLNFIKYSLSI